tara:strand:+ start:438 stop:620 length:183 start_codon:yes stop_codon:yes gene_type:complete
VEVEKRVEKEVPKYNKLDLNKDGIVSESELDVLRNKIKQIRKQGDDAQADLLSQLLPPSK